MRAPMSWICPFDIGTTWLTIYSTCFSLELTVLLCSVDQRLKLALLLVPVLTDYPPQFYSYIFTSLQSLSSQHRLYTPRINMSTLAYLPYLFIVFFAYSISRYYFKNRGLPPGPPRLPFIGNIHQLPTQVFQHFSICMFLERV